MRKKAIKSIIVSLMLIVGLYFYIQISEAESKVFKVTFLDIGQGDAALIRFSNGEKMLVDCGVSKKILEKLGEHLPFYDRTLDYLMISHPDSDHYGGCVDVLKRYEVRNIITNGDTKTDQYWKVWEKYLGAENAQEKIIDRPQIMEIGDAQLNFISPDKSLGLDTKLAKGNNNSIVFKLERGEKSFLFVGDAEAPVENALINKYCTTSTISGDSVSMNLFCDSLDSDYLKVGHHGSDSSSGEGFIKAVSPESAIISVGKNSFGHPSLRIMKKLERLGVGVLRTDEKGDIIFEENFFVK